MRTAFSLCILLLCTLSPAQLKYHYENADLTIPDWLTNPNYIDENKTEEYTISIDENDLKTIDGVYVVEIRKSESEHNNDETSIYLATFNAELNILDICLVNEYSSSDWNWPESDLFEEVALNIFRYFYVGLKYRPAETEKEQNEYGGMVLSEKDTTQGYYKIENDGSVSFSEDMESLSNIQSDKDDTDLNVDNPNQKAAEKTVANTGFDQEACILQIRQIYTDINKNSGTYQKKIKLINNNINLIIFFEGSIVKKINVEYSGSQTEEYYYDKEKLIFVFSFNKLNKEQNRFYFHNNQMFRWHTGSEKKLVSAISDEFKAKEKKLLSNSSMYSKN